MDGASAGTVMRLTGMVIATLCLAGAVAAAELTLPQEVFYYHPVATVYGHNAVWINPAALADGNSGSMVLFTHRQKRIIRDWGASAVVRMFSVAYRHVANQNQSDHDEYIFALGGGDRGKVGLSYRYIKNGVGYLNHRHLWTAGVLFQNLEHLSLGARFENLNRGKIDGERSDVRFVYGAATRLYRDLVTVSFDVDMTHKENLDAADFRTGVEVRPTPGLYLSLDFDNHAQFNLGIRLNFGQSYAGHYQEFGRRGKSRLSTSYIGSVTGKQPSLTQPRPKALMVRVDGELPENPKMPVFGKRPLKYFDYIDGIYRAAGDDAVDRLFLHIGTLTCGIGRVEELSEAVAYFRSRGKMTCAYIDNANNLGYLLAAAADSIVIPPVSQVNLIGLRAELSSIKGLMDKVGIEAEVERVDQYKTAPEPLMFDRPTDPSREQISRILDSLYAGLVDAVASHRGLSRDSVRALIDRAPLTSVAAREAGLVDRLTYLDEAKPAAGRQMKLESYVRQRVCHDRWGAPPQVALVIADGSISEGRSGGKIGEFEMLDVIRQVREDAAVKGVVLRVNSPGGSALASDLLWHEIDLLAARKPLVISMGNVAASGGYYISCVKVPIFVDRSTVTGSIGVYGGKANLSKMLDKIGVYTESHRRGLNAGMYSLYEPYTDDQRRQLRGQLWEFYRHFTQRVAEARHLAADSVDALGRGQVWTGNEAVHHGLADHMGGVYQALETVIAECGAQRETVTVVSYPAGRYFFKSPTGVAGLLGRAVSRWLGPGGELAVATFTDSDHIFFRMPYNIVIE